MSTVFARWSRTLQPCIPDKFIQDLASSFKEDPGIPQQSIDTTKTNAATFFIRINCDANRKYAFGTLPTHVSQCMGRSSSEMGDAINKERKSRENLIAVTADDNTRLQDEASCPEFASKFNLGLMRKIATDHKPDDKDIHLSITDGFPAVGDATMPTSFPAAPFSISAA